MDYEDIIVEVTSGVTRITINRPRVYNAFRDETVDELIDAFIRAADDESVGVIVITGAGKNFCTGGDVNWEQGFDQPTGRQLVRRMMRLSAEMRNCGKPVIAMVRGYCIGAGNEINMLCDLTVASDTAIFGQVGPKMGSVPVWYGTQMLPRLVGEKKAREVVFLCRRYDASTAERMGLCNAVVPDAELEAVVQEWCDELLAKSSQALRIAKTTMNFESDQLYPGVVHGGLLLSQVHGSPEFQEGVDAFVEKRAPDFAAFRVPVTSNLQSSK